MMDDRFNELIEKKNPVDGENWRMVLEGRLPNSEDGPIERTGTGNSRDVMCSVLNAKTTSYSGSSGIFFVEESTWILFFWRSASPGLSSTFSKKSLSTRNRIAWDKFETVFLISGNSN